MNLDRSNLPIRSSLNIILCSFLVALLPLPLRGQQAVSDESVRASLETDEQGTVLSIQLNQSTEDLQDYHYFIDTSSDLENWKARYYEDVDFSVQKTDSNGGGQSSQVNLPGAISTENPQFARFRAVAKNRQSTSLITPSEGFSNDSHIVSTTFFHWFASTGGQLTGPWVPVEKRVNWTGLPPWWKSMVKQVMMANIDVIYLHLINSTEERRVTLFMALNELLQEGYDIPKIAPFLDPLITWNGQAAQDLSQAAVKDEVANQYIRFYNQYIENIPHALAFDYLAKLDGRPMIASWHAHISFFNLSSLTREDLRSRFDSALGESSPLFKEDPYMVTTALNNPAFAFADERVPMFEINQYYYENFYNDLRTVQLKPGYWDQNIRNPGDFLARDGGSHFKAAWEQVHENINRVYVESFNEYDEGTGIYAGSVDSDSPFINPGSGNGNTDTWSSNSDPYEYIRTTATGAALFNDTPALDTLILNHTLPDSLTAGQSATATVTLRNQGDESWTGAAGFKFVQVTNDEATFLASPIVIDDNSNEIPIYSGIFRGRPITFSLNLTAPTMPGYYETRWQMYKGDQPFGEVLSFPIEVVSSL